MDTQSNVTSTTELESQLGQIRLSIDEIVHQRVRQWLSAFYAALFFLGVYEFFT